MYVLLLCRTLASFVFRVFNACLRSKRCPRKPAYMQYQYKPGDNRYDASNAVDGQKSNLSFNGGQCSSSVASKQTATWWVNLTKIYNIHHIRIYFLKSRYEWGMVIFNCCPLITYTSSKLYSLVSFRNILFLRLCMTS